MTAKPYGEAYGFSAPLDAGQSSAYYAAKVGGKSAAENHTKGLLKCLLKE